LRIDGLSTAVNFENGHAVVFVYFVAWRMFGGALGVVSVDALSLPNVLQAVSAYVQMLRGCVPARSQPRVHTQRKSNISQ